MEMEELCFLLNINLYVCNLNQSWNLPMYGIFIFHFKKFVITSIISNNFYCYLKISKNILSKNSNT